MSWKTIWLALKNSDMRKKILAVLAMLLVFRIMAHIPIPLANSETLKQLLENLYQQTKTTQLLSFLDVLSGGALANFSIMLIGLGPYINASIIMQLLTQAIPKLEKLNQEGEYGRRKINQYTRILAFPLAIVQSIGAIYLVRQQAQQISGIGDITAHANIWQWGLMVLALTGGSMILMWLGELITEQGVGNGISLLITVGIVSRLPATISNIMASASAGQQKLKLLGTSLPFTKQGAITLAAISFATVIITYLVVKLNEASRNITINYAKRVQGNKAYGGVTSVLPIKLITAGVVPIIFAVAFLSVPQFAGQLLKTNTNETLAHIGTNLSTWFASPTASSFATGGWHAYIYPLTYFFLVFVFTFFYTGITFNAKDIAENLQKQGGFIGEVRAGEQTRKYLSKVVNHLNLFGATSLGFLALTPIVAQVLLKTDNIAIGGTSVLILVSVALETLRQIESKALMVTYDQYVIDYTGDEAPLDPVIGKRRFGLRRRKSSK